SGEQTFVLRARPKPTSWQVEKLSWIYGPHAPADLIQDVERGLFVFSTKRLQVGNRFSADWETEPLTSAP
ncbi:MAG: hypothetical protein ACREDL_09900, partial [Bradyrhizobium sp.]